MKKLVIAIMVGAALVSVSCTKKRLEKKLYGQYERTVSGNVYTDSTTQLLLTNENVTFSNGGEIGELYIGGEFASSVFYETEKSEIEDYDLELKFQNLDYSEWLPKNYVNGSGGTVYNSVVPNTTVLDQVRYFVKIDKEKIDFVIVYPSYTEVQTYTK